MFPTTAQVVLRPALTRRDGVGMEKAWPDVSSRQVPPVVLSAEVVERTSHLNDQQRLAGSGHPQAELSNVLPVESGTGSIAHDLNDWIRHEMAAVRLPGAMRLDVIPFALFPTLRDAAVHIESEVLSHERTPRLPVTVVSVLEVQPHYVHNRPVVIH